MKIPLMLAVVGLVLSSLSSSAQETTLISWTNNPWAFNDTTLSTENLHGTGWELPAYNTNSAPGWKTGPALFGNDSAGLYDGAGRPFSGGIAGFLTPLDRSNSRITFYFRNKFIWPSSPVGVALHATWVHDDGFIVYLNGQEVLRSKMSVPAPDPVTWDTLGVNHDAGTPIVVEGFEFNQEIPSAALVQGENVIAVELHQSGAGSSDISFALQLKGIVPFAVTNLNVLQPTNRTILQSRSSVLQVFANGSPAPQYQWFVDNNPIPDATNSTLLVTNESPVMSTSNFFCRVSNSLGMFDSRTALITFDSDPIPPTLVRAVAGATNQIHLQFSESIDPLTGTDEFNYGLSGGLMLMADPVLSPSGRTVILSFSGTMSPDTLYTITVSGVTDLAGNLIAPASIIQFRSWVPTLVGGWVFEAYNGTPSPNTVGTIEGNAVVNLTGHASYPNNPSEVLVMPGSTTRLLTGAAYEGDTHDRYGARVRGLFFPPESGNWIFHLSPDDGGELYLNPNGANAAGKTLIAQQTGCCNLFSATGPFRSAPIPLVGGQPYYIEGLYKEGIGGDYFHVATTLDGEVIPADGGGNGCASCGDPSKVGFGAMPAGAAGSFTISQQPANTQVIAASTATFSVGINQTLGLPVLYQWMRGGTPIPGENRSSYSFIPSIADDNAVFSVAVTNLDGVGTVSANATLDVLVDTFPPTVVSVTASLDGTTIAVVYNEGMEASSAGDAFTYTINGVQAQSASLSADLRTATVVLGAPVTTPCLLNSVVITDARDIAQNNISPNPTTVTFTAPLVLVGNNDTQIWRFDYSGTDYDATWLTAGFDDSTWGMGPGPIAMEGPETMPAGWPIRTALTDWAGARITTYFRTHFNLATDPRTITSLQLSEVIDDASVAYINGVEVHRLRVNAGPVIYGTQANAGAPSEAPHPVEGPFVIPTSSLVYGDNVLAIRVHQSGTASSDMVMGAQLLAVVSGCAPGLTATLVSPGMYRLTWPDPAYKLQTAPTVTGPWLTDQNAVSGVVVPVPGTGNGFIRLVKP